MPLPWLSNTRQQAWPGAARSNCIIRVSVTMAGLRFLGFAKYALHGMRIAGVIALQQTVQVQGDIANADHGMQAEKIAGYLHRWRRLIPVSCPDAGDSIKLLGSGKRLFLP